MIEELARHRCTGDDGTPVLVVERCHVFTTQSDAGTRRHLGASGVALLDGEPVRYIDAHTFEVIATGELLSHDPSHCDCTPAAQITTSSPGA